ncbi:MAG: ABC transporter substrate-binding protein [Burkholderiaceae bacterium]|nr:ABC transporter substrate-binding protein [Burkholderiaceae bacterium]
MKFFATLLVCMSLVTTAFAAAPGVTDTQIVIGQSAPLTGPAAQLGIRLRMGIEAYFKQVNADGGVAGRTLKLVSLDDGYEPPRAVANTKTFIDGGDVFALLGYVGTPTTLAAKPLIDNVGIPLIGPFTGAMGLRTPVDPYIFNIRASYNDETRKIVDQFLFLGLKRIAVFYQDDAYGMAGLTGVQKALAAHGLKPVATGTVKRNTVDVAAALASILPAKPDLIVEVGTYTEVAAFNQQAIAKGYVGQFANVSFVGSEALAKALGPQGNGVIITQVVPFPFSTVTPLVREYQAAMNAAGHKNDYDFTSLEGYIDAKVLVLALRKAGKALTRPGLIDALNNMSNENLGGFTVRFSAGNHSGSDYVDTTSITANGDFRH